MKGYKLVLIVFLFKTCFAQDRVPFDFDPNPNFSRDISVNRVLFPFGFMSVSGNYGVYLKRRVYQDGSNASNRITKPFIIVEGWDASNTRSSNDIYTSMNHNRLIQELREDGWDIIILNLFNNSAEIEKNAELVKQLLRDINNELANNGSTFHPVVMGISMGGLIVRYALASMETGLGAVGAPVGLPEGSRVEKYISFDSPHQGANVPLGVQQFALLLPEVAAGAAFQTVAATIPEQFNPVSMINDLFGVFTDWVSVNEGTYIFKPAATQMLMYTPAAPINPSRTSFLLNLATAGWYPRNCRRIGVANGTNATIQNCPQTGGKLLDWDASWCAIENAGFDLPFDLGRVSYSYCPLSLDLEISAMPGDGLYRTLNFGMGSKIGVNANDYNTIPFSNFSFGYHSVYGNVDNAPGGIYDAMNEPIAGIRNAINSRVIDFGLVIRQSFCAPEIPGLPRICRDVTFYERNFLRISNPLGTMADHNFQWTFVPTVSALDVNNNFNWSFNFDNIANENTTTFARYNPNPQIGVLPPANTSPFNVLYTHDRNMPHANVESRRMARFISEEVSPMDLYIQNVIFPTGYATTFESRRRIVVGRQVDIVTGRQEEGDVVLQDGSNILFSVNRNGGTLDFEDGFDSGNGTFDTRENALPSTPYDFDDDRLSGQCLNSTTPVANPTRKSVMDSEMVSDRILDYGSPVTETIQSSAKPILEAMPNPFSEYAKLQFTIFNPAKVTVVIYNQSGAAITTLMYDTPLKEGTYTFDFQPSNLPDGIYYYNVVVDGKQETKKMVLKR